MDNNKKINVDDISFNDMLDGGIEDLVETVEEPQIEKPIENVETAEAKAAEVATAVTQAKTAADAAGAASRPIWSTASAVSQDVVDSE